MGDKISIFILDYIIQLIDKYIPQNCKVNYDNENQNFFSAVENLKTKPEFMSLLFSKVFYICLKLYEFKYNIVLLSKKKIENI